MCTMRCCGWLLVGVGTMLVVGSPPVPAQTVSVQPASERQEELKHKADDAYRAGDFDTTILLASQVLAESASDPVALYLRASAKVEQGIAGGAVDRIRSGIEDARTAIRLDTARKPDYYLPYLYGMAHLTRLEGNRGHAESAVTTATKVLQRSNLDPQVKANLLYQRGVARVQLDRLDVAIDDFRRVLDLEATHLAARMALGDVLLQSGDVKAAEESLDAAVESFPAAPLVFNNRGTFHQSQGNYDQAIVDFTQAISLDASYVQAYLNRGFTFLQSGNPSAAAGDMNAVLDREPQNAAAYSLLGTARLRQGDIKGSIGDYTRSVELNPANAAARADLGFAYFFSGDYRTAAAAFDQSLTLQPKNDFLEPWRYTALVRSGQEEQAQASYAHLREKPVEQQTWFDALTLLLMGQLTEEQLIARVESRDARLKDAQICEAYYFIGVSRLPTDPEEAAAYFRRALRSQARQLSAYQAAQIAVGDNQSPPSTTR